MVYELLINVILVILFMCVCVGGSLGTHFSCNIFARSSFSQWYATMKISHDFLFPQYFLSIRGSAVFAFFSPFACTSFRHLSSLMWFYHTLNSLIPLGPAVTILPSASSFAHLGTWHCTACLEMGLTVFLLVSFM